ncbi:MAG: LptF/LptG family permease [Bacteroidales bacterium]|nr:LptF/LptG family permease [Bacteroidales bacterium]
MKKLDRLILRSFLGPLLLTFTIAEFVLLMQFVWKYIDDMVGKGLPFGVLAELMFYAAVTFVPMALPIAVLFASIMTMGNFGERYELVAMKAGGVSIRRVMMPLAMVTLLLTGVAYYFSNDVLPVAMLKYKMTLFDVTRKKPALNIKPSEYYSEIEGYVIRANEKDPNNGTLHDIIIYDHTKHNLQNTVVVADSGIMRMSPDERYLIFTLFNGNTYNEELDGDKHMTRPFTEMRFQKQVMTFDLSSFAFDKTSDDFFKGSYQMMNIEQLKENVAKLERTREVHYDDERASLTDRMRCARIALPMLDMNKETRASQKERKETAAIGDLKKIMNDAALGVPQNFDAQARTDVPQAEMQDGEAAPKANEFLARKRRRTAQFANQGLVLDPMRQKEQAKDYSKVPVFSRQVLAQMSKPERERVVRKAKENLKASQNEIRMYKDMIHADSEYINRHYIEWQRKYTLSLACLVLFLVGAPFGSIVRKGGLGLPLVASVFFFVMYYVIGMIAEKSVREGALGPIGMWTSTFVMLPIGMLLTFYAATEGGIFSRSARRRAKNALKLVKPTLRTTPATKGNDTER